MLHALLAVGWLIPPVPPRGSTRLVYGVEPTARWPKGSDPSKLLSPAVELVDPLYELRYRENPASVAHICAENAYVDSAMAQDAGWRSAIAEMDELLKEFQPASRQPPSGFQEDLLWHRGSDTAGWEYARRKIFPNGWEQPFPQFVRRRVGSADVQLVLDANRAPALLPSEDCDYSPSGCEACEATQATVRGISAFVPSPDGTFVAYTVDTSGEESFSLMIARLRDDGILPAAMSPFHSVHCVDVDVRWGYSVGAAATSLFYATMDSTGRPYQVR